MDLEKQKEHFKDNIATFSDYGNIKIVDFQKPSSSEYRIRFLFEEDHHRLHISGDLGELMAFNDNNMCYEGFGDFVNNTDYFREKIDCCDRDLYFYDVDLARKQLQQVIIDRELVDDIAPLKYYSPDDVDDAVTDFIDNVLEDFDCENGIGFKGYAEASEYIPDLFDDFKDLGKTETGILDLYMMAYKMAIEQLKGKNKK
jgi:hypothetical protein